jgi:hypothetical protein
MLAGQAERSRDPPPNYSIPNPRKCRARHFRGYAAYLDMPR